MLKSMRSLIAVGGICVAVTLLPSAVSAANCVRNVDILNSDRDEDLTFLVESRTRANPTWRTVRLGRFVQNRNVQRRAQNLRRRLPARQNNDGGRRASVDHGERYRDTITYGLVGCNVKREARIIVRCTSNGSETTKFVRSPWSGFQKPRDIKLRFDCD